MAGRLTLCPATPTTHPRPAKVSDDVVLSAQHTYSSQKDMLTAHTYLARRTCSQQLPPKNQRTTLAVISTTSYNQIARLLGKGQGLALLTTCRFVAREVLVISKASTYVQLNLSHVLVITCHDQHAVMGTCCTTAFIVVCCTFVFIVVCCTIAFISVFHICFHSSVLHSCFHSSVLHKHNIKAWLQLRSCNTQTHRVRSNLLSIS